MSLSRHSANEWSTPRKIRPVSPARRVLVNPAGNILVTPFKQGIPQSSAGPSTVRHGLRLLQGERPFHELVFLNQERGRLRAHERGAFLLETHEQSMVSTARFRQVRDDVDLPATDRQPILIDTQRLARRAQTLDSLLDPSPVLIDEVDVALPTSAAQALDLQALNGLTQRSHVGLCVDDGDVYESPATAHDAQVCLNVAHEETR